MGDISTLCVQIFMWLSAIVKSYQLIIIIFCDFSVPEPITHRLFYKSKWHFMGLSISMSIFMLTSVMIAQWPVGSYRDMQNVATLMSAIVSDINEGHCHSQRQYPSGVAPI